MAETGASYDDVLARAQELGYAEADPTEDVNGADAAAKMAILARLAFHAPVTLDQVSFEGIESVQPDDLSYAKELGLSLKLLGVAEKLEGGIAVRVFPCFLYPGHPLAPIGGPPPTAHELVVDDLLTPASIADVIVSEAATTAGPTYTVRSVRGSYWSIAEQTLEDGRRWAEIRDLNAGRTMGDGTVKDIKVKCRIDTAIEIEYIEHGGVLHYVLRNLAAAA